MSNDRMVNCPLCKGTGKMGELPCKGCKGKKRLKMKFAERDRIGYLSIYVKVVMEAIKKVTGIRASFISDRSSVWDFIDTKGKKEQVAKVRELSQELGIPVDIHDEIHVLAKRLKDL